MFARIANFVTHQGQAKAAHLAHSAAVRRLSILALLSLTSLAVFSLATFLALEAVDAALANQPMVSLLAKLSFVASILSLAIFALELFRDRPQAQGAQETAVSNGVLARAVFEGLVEAGIRSGGSGALILLSLGTFPRAAAGRSLQETLLKETALRLREHLPDTAFITLWADAELAILLADTSEGEVRFQVDQLFEACVAPVAIGVRMVELQPKAGVALIEPGVFERSDQAVHVARVALHRAESATSPHYVFYDAELSARAADEEMLVQQLPRAIYDRKLDVYLQPSVRLSDAGLCGFEALVRWSSKDRLIAAQEIVSAAETAGLLVELDTFVLDEAIRLVSDWNRRRKTAFCLSVNLSSIHFLTPSGTGFIRDTLAAHGFPPEQLTIEISETEYLAHQGDLAPALRLLGDLGVRLCIDDFGAGQSTLADLRALPADEIKIDGSLVEDLEASLDGQAILRAILDMTRHLNIDTVIEGVERASQADALLALGCSRAQGYLYGRPRPALDWLADATYGPAGEGQARLQ